MAGYVLNMGGTDHVTYYNTVDVFKVTEMGIKKNTAGLTLSVARQGLAAAACGDYVLAMGGNDTSTYSDAVDVFHVTENGIEHVTGHSLSLSTGREALAAAACGDYVLAMGGWDGTSTYYDDIDVFHVTDNGIEAVAGHDLTLSVARSRLATATCGDYVLAMGGHNGISYSDAVDVFRVTENGIEAVADHGLSLSVARSSLAAATCGNYILAMGGDAGVISDAIDVFRVTDNGIEAVAGHGLTLSEARRSATAAACGNYILVMGGYNGGYVNTIDVFRVTDNGIEAVAGHGLTLSEARSSLAAATCGNYVLAMGGQNANYLDTVDVFELF